MKHILSVENMRKSDARAIADGTEGKELMFRAGKAVFDIVKKFKPPFAVVCGSGNNAGDGYVLAALLHREKIPVTVFLLEDRFSEDGRYYYEKCAEEGVEIRFFENQENAFDAYHTIIDCIFGTGFRGEVKGAAAAAIRAIRRTAEIPRGPSGGRAAVVAVDINSGLNGDSGLCADENLCVRSDLTISVGGFKSGHFLNMAKDVMERKCNCDIGISPADRPYMLFEQPDLLHVFRPRKHFSNKSTYGYIALIGGSVKYSGAARLAAMAAAAMRSGAGVVSVAVPGSLSLLVSQSVLESTVLPLSEEDGELSFNRAEIEGIVKKYRTVAFGMGLGLGKGAEKTLKYLLSNYSGTLIVDADGLTLLSRLPREEISAAKCSLVLTPHTAELSRLTGKSAGDILSAPVSTAEEYVKTLKSTGPVPASKGLSGPRPGFVSGADPDSGPDAGRKRASSAGVPRRVLLLKGPSTIVTDGDWTIIVDAGCAGMATAGSGDVLSGVLAAVCAGAGGPSSSADRPAADRLAGEKDFPPRGDAADSPLSAGACGPAPSAADADPLTLAVAGAAYINGKAGELAEQRTGPVSMIAGDTIKAIPEMIKSLRDLEQF